ncbi:hypothetical protein KBD87_03015 [Candidatus Saccharibacteria bacterium]|nr:hypothetical protein [Candidatus Saccharibacteria bacterium]
MIRLHSSQKGAVSLFIVIFTSLLVTVVATSFIQIMLKNQQQASNADLSQRAYDSALAGVEDAKRALVRMKECDKNGDPCGAQIRNALNTHTCTSLEATGMVDFQSSEVAVGTDPNQNQAYTCVEVELDTKYVEGNLEQDGSSSVTRLASKDVFNKVRISWFSAADVGDATSSPVYYDQTGLQGLPPKSSWPDTSPPIMRSQLLEFSPGVSLDTRASWDRTLFLYPFKRIAAGTSSFNFSQDARGGSAQNDPKPTVCEESFTATPTNPSGSLYLCSATIVLPSDARQKYLQLTALYNHAHYRVELLKDSHNVLFDSVQPMIDSTGRASDQFRRVRARVSVGNLPTEYPSASVSVHSNLCKNFFVTSDKSDYQSRCTP